MDFIPANILELHSLLLLDLLVSFLFGTGEEGADAESEEEDLDYEEGDRCVVCEALEAISERR